MASPPRPLGGEGIGLAAVAAEEAAPAEIRPIQNRILIPIPIRIGPPARHNAAKPKRPEPGRNSCH